MQAAYTEESLSSKTFHLLGTVKPAATTPLITNNTNLISPSLSDGGFDTCSFYSGPSDSTIMAFGENSESCGSIAYSGSESCGSIAYSGGGESCGSIASSSSTTSCCCSYSC